MLSFLAVEEELKKALEANTQLQKINAQQSERILQLEEQLSWLNRQLFGRKSEQQPSEQPGELFDPEGLGTVAKRS